MLYTTLYMYNSCVSSCVFWMSRNSQLSSTCLRNLQVFTGTSIRALSTMVSTKMLAPPLGNPGSKSREQMTLQFQSVSMLKCRAAYSNPRSPGVHVPSNLVWHNSTKSRQSWTFRCFMASQRGNTCNHSTYMQLLHDSQFPWSTLGPTCHLTRSSY